HVVHPHLRPFPTRRSSDLPDNCAGCCTPTGRCPAGTGSLNCGLYGAACDNCFARGETCQGGACGAVGATCPAPYPGCTPNLLTRSEEHTSELQSLTNLVCR